MEFNVDGKSSVGNIVNRGVLNTGRQPDRDKRQRREVANSNERRRMQSINLGFNKLKSFLPYKEDAKLSKATVLEQICQLVENLRRQNQLLLEENMQLVQLVNITFRNTGFSLKPIKKEMYDYSIDREDQWSSCQKQDPAHIKSPTSPVVEHHWNRTESSHLDISSGVNRKLSCSAPSSPMLSSSVSSRNLSIIVDAIREIENRSVAMDVESTDSENAAPADVTVSRAPKTSIQETPSRSETLWVNSISHQINTSVSVVGAGGSLPNS